MADILITILSSAGISALIAGALVFLAKSWISERLKGAIKCEYDQLLETHKSQLKAQSDTQLEQFKAQLHIAAAERSIRLTRVFEKTVDTVAGTYERLIAFSDAVAAYTSIMEWSTDPSKPERRKLVADRLSEFQSYYRPRRPFLPKRTVASIDEFRKKLHHTSVDFMIGVEQGHELGGAGEKRDVWVEAHKFTTEEVPPILTLLEDDLRKILGTHEEA